MNEWSLPWHEALAHLTKGRVWSLVSSEIQQYITVCISLLYYCHCDDAAYWYPQNYQWFMDVNLLFCTRGSIGWLRFSHSWLGSTQLRRTRLDSRFQAGFRSVSRVFIPRLRLKEQQPPGRLLPEKMMETPEEAGRNLPCSLTPETWHAVTSAHVPAESRSRPSRG